MKDFVLIYNRISGALRLSEFDDPAEAVRVRLEREKEFRDDPNTEVVLITAESLDDIKKTHSRYFLGVADNFSLSGEYDLVGVEKA